MLAPILLVALRFVQGMALGGEWAGAVLLSVEHGDEQQRGRNASWAQMGPSLGTLLATGAIALVTLLLSRRELSRWGWRLPLFASVVLVAFGLWLRVGVQETPLFRQLEREQSQARAPLGEVVREHWRRLLLGGGARIGPDVLYSLVAVFSLSLPHHDARPVAHARADRAVDRRRVQCSDDPDLRDAVRSFRPPRRLWHRRGAARLGCAFAVLPAARYRIAGGHRVRHRRRR